MELTKTQSEVLDRLKKGEELGHSKCTKREYYWVDSGRAVRPNTMKFLLHHGLVYLEPENPDYSIVKLKNP